MTYHATRSRLGRRQVAAHVGLLIAHSLSLRGVDPRPLCTAIGFDIAGADDPAARISLATEQALWESAAVESRDPDFGLHTAESLKPGAFHVLDYAVRSAPTLKVALERLLRYSRLTHEPAIFRMSSGSSTLRIEHCFRSDSVLPCRQEAEFTLASIVVIGRQIVDERFKPVRVEFMHAKPSETREHARIFGLLPEFSSWVNALEIDRSLLNRELTTADTVLSRIIQGHAEALLNTIPSESVTEELRAALTKLLPEGRCTIAAVAPMVRMSQRTLQRKLERENTTFAKVLDDLRHDLGLRYLKEGRVTLAEIAYLLGYSEPSPFHRAFRRWTGSTPQALRKQS